MSLTLGYDLALEVLKLDGDCRSNISQSLTLTFDKWHQQVVPSSVQLVFLHDRDYSEALWNRGEQIYIPTSCPTLFLGHTLEHSWPRWTQVQVQVAPQWRSIIATDVPQQYRADWLEVPQLVKNS